MRSVTAPPEMARNQQPPANSQPASTPAPAPGVSPVVPRGPRAQRHLTQQPPGSAPSSQPAQPPQSRTLAEIFADDGSDESPPGTATADDPTMPPDTLDALVERLGLTHEQVYAIKIGMPEGAEPMTLGAIKDRVSNAVDLEQRELAFDQRRVKAEGELLRGQTELRELLSLLPKGSVSPEIVNKMRERHNVTMKRERELTLEHIPDWQDEERMTKDVDGIAEWLHEEYGFDRSFVTTIVDHRALKFVRDMFLRDQKIKTALAGVETPSTRTQRPSSRQQPTRNGNGQAPTNPARSQSASNRRRGATTERDRIMAVLNK